MPRLSKPKKENDELPALKFTECHAKTGPDDEPGTTVLEHLFSVAAVCEHLVQTLPPSLGQVGKAAIKAAAMHDVGKVSPGFQMKYFREKLYTLHQDYRNQSLAKYATNHALTGASAIWDYINTPFNFPLFAHIAAIHHGAIKSAPSPIDTSSENGGKNWSRQRQLLLEEIEKNYGPIEPVETSPVLRNCIAGMVTVSDWIGSDERFFPSDGLPADSDVKSAAREAIDSCLLKSPSLVPNKTFEEIFKFPPYQLQQDFARIANTPGVYVLEAPMGMGKTEAALFAAYNLISTEKNNGLFFGLPTRLTSDRIYHRLDSFLDAVCEDGTRPKLAHGSAWLTASEREGGELAAGGSWFSPKKRALIHPFVVGTIDQALLSVLRVKHYFVRTYGLAGKVVILDEVHSYDGYTGTLMDDMVQQLAELGCTVIILSATLTSERRNSFFPGKSSNQDLSTYPLITASGIAASPPPPPSLEYTVSLKEMDEKNVALHAAEKARQGHCVLCIANTVATAQLWFDAIRAEIHTEEVPIGLLHSKFPAYRRADIENHWMDCLGKQADRPYGAILVATQVVEQSVDIDTDSLITELAPTDMLLQRIGRVWRHPRNGRPCDKPEVILVTGDAENAATVDEILERFGKGTCKVYAPWVLWQTWNVWKERQSVTIPDDIRHLIEATYSNDIADTNQLAIALLQEFNEMRDSLVSKAKAALATVESMPVGDDKEEYATRYSDYPTGQVLLVRKIDKVGQSTRIELLSGETVKVDAYTPHLPTTKKLYANLVSVAAHLLRGLPDPKANSFLAKHFFEPTHIFVWDHTTGQIEVDGSKTSFLYSDAKGLYRYDTQSAITETNRRYLSEYEEIDVFNKARFDW